MTPYADTNFFTRCLVPLTESPAADALSEKLDATGGILPVTWLLQLEVANALQRLVFECKHRPQGFHITWQAALMAEEEFADIVAAGTTWRAVEISPSELENQFSALVHRHTAKYGFRTYDILHVASALVLECDTFWSFDKKAKKLAALEGLKAN